MTFHPQRGHHAVDILRQPPPPPAVNALISLFQPEQAGLQDPYEQPTPSHALLVIRCGPEKFPAITSIGGVRPDALPDHPSDRALDLMIPH